MIRNYRDKDTQALAELRPVTKFPPYILSRAIEKLRFLDYADNLNDLRTPPGNRLEALSGNRRGQHSIRINDQWRICFVWYDGNAWDVEITDYH